MARQNNHCSNEFKQDAVMESFFHSLRTELVYGTVFRTRAQARRELYEYIEVWYNRQRGYSAPGYQHTRPGYTAEEQLCAFLDGQYGDLHGRRW